MKTRSRFFQGIGLLILLISIALFTFSARDQSRAQVFPATINRDCAPWDGSAFTVSIRYDPITTIIVSIWQSPDINIPTTFTFPDDSGQVGFAYILPELDPLQQLTGKVFFTSVESEFPVEGWFDFVTEAGQRITGRFKAEWENTVAMCG
ncbi:MAG TPA: hypothetical protein VJ022_12500 [Anaerolineales bacterium]|nr:hypothetical protein [Anaerolineales bacterium]